MIMQLISNNVGKEGKQHSDWKPGGINRELLEQIFDIDQEEEECSESSDEDDEDEEEEEEEYEEEPSPDDDQEPHPTYQPDKESSVSEDV